MSDLDEMLKAAGISDGTGESVDPDTFRSGFVTLVGRPNAGKSTLFNALTNQAVYADDKLFATLDTTVRS